MDRVRDFQPRNVKEVNEEIRRRTAAMMSEGRISPEETQIAASAQVFEELLELAVVRLAAAAKQDSLGPGSRISIPA